MTSLKIETRLKALAQLVLHLIPNNIKNTVGDAPTDEELTALYENQLDDTRRAQVLAFIANDTVVHDRWIRCVETQAFMEESDTKQSAIVNNKTLYTKLSEFINSKMLLGGGFSTAAAIVLILAVLPPKNDIDIELSLNEVYSTWGNSLENEWGVLDNDKKPTPNYSDNRSFFDEDKTKSTIQQVIETGFRVSVDKLGSAPFKNYGITSSTLSEIEYTAVANSMSRQQYDALIQTGQLAAIAAVQCKLNSESKRLDSLSASLSVLKQQFIELETTETKALSNKMKSNTKLAVCETAEYIVELITKQ